MLSYNEQQNRFYLQNGQLNDPFEMHYLEGREALRRRLRAMEQLTESVDDGCKNWSKEGF